MLVGVDPELALNNSVHIKSHSNIYSVNIKINVSDDPLLTSKFPSNEFVESIFS